MKNVKKIFCWILYVFITFFLIINVISIISTVVLKKDYPNVLGYSYFEVSSNSMYPTLKKGDLIIIKLKNDNYIVGDIITYKDNDMYTTHRLVEINSKGYVTKGDSNNTSDPIINKEKIIGKVIVKMNFVGFLIQVLKKPIIIIIAFLIIILTYFKK